MNHIFMNAGNYELPVKDKPLCVVACDLDIKFLALGFSRA